jgi:hypothetical protein
MKGLNKASAQLNCRAKDKICYKWPLPAKAIRQDAEEDLQRRYQYPSEYALRDQTIELSDEVTRPRKNTPGIDDYDKSGVRPIFHKIATS